jgi:hypothetical protein
MTTWRKGPPPSIGWWPASSHRNPAILRWWDGEAWSFAAHDEMTAEDAAEQSTEKTYSSNDIEWTDRPAWWPERSRT